MELGYRGPNGRNAVWSSLAEPNASGENFLLSDVFFIVCCFVVVFSNLFQPLLYITVNPKT